MSEPDYSEKQVGENRVQHLLRNHVLFKLGSLLSCPSFIDFTNSPINQLLYDSIEYILYLLICNMFLGIVLKFFHRVCKSVKRKAEIYSNVTSLVLPSGVYGTLGLDTEISWHYSDCQCPLCIYTFSVSKYPCTPF